MTSGSSGRGLGSLAPGAVWLRCHCWGDVGTDYPIEEQDCAGGGGMQPGATMHSGPNQGFLSNGSIGCVYLVKILAHCAMLQCMSRYNKPP